MATPFEVQSLGTALGAAKEYADTVVKGPLSQIGGILTDTVGYWRLKNQVRLILKAKVWLEEKGVEPTKLLPDVFVPLLDDGGNVSDENLADMFASLLASHLDPAQRESVHPSYTNVLSQLSPFDAKLMLEFRRLASDPMARDVGLRGAVMPVAHAAEVVEAPKRVTYLSCLNLYRLGILDHIGYQVPPDHPIPDMFETIADNQEYRISEYGIAFCDACQYS